MLSPEDVRLALAKIGPSHSAMEVEVRKVLGPEARDAVVLLPLSFEPKDVLVHAVVRAASLRDHAGEVSFPGGKVETGETFESALVREAEEEAGLGAADIDILGRLSAVPVVTGRFLIHPFVGAVRRRPRITSAEHAEIHHVRLGRWLEDDEEIEMTEAPWRGLPLVVPHFAIGERVMYGASAAVFFELLSLLAPRPLRTRMVEEKPWGKRYEAHERR